MPKILFLFFLPIFFSCSNSNEEGIEPDNQTDDEVVFAEEDNQEESETKILSISIKVDGVYFNDNFEGLVFLTNKEGDILISKKLENDLDNVIEYEVNSATNYDLTYLTRKTPVNGYPVDIHTFMNIQSGQYTLEASKEGIPGNDDMVVTFLNTGFPLEKINFFTSTSIADPEGNGSYELETLPSKYSGSVYAAFKSPNDDFSRYYFEKGIEPNSNFEINYQDLPAVQNEISLTFPSGSEFFNARIFGFIESIEGTESFSVDESDSFVDTYLYPEGVFTNFKLSASLTFGNTSQKRYELSKFGKPQSQTFNLPNLEGTILNSNLNDFSFKANSNYDFSTTYYGFYDRSINTFYRYYIHGVGTENIDFSMNNAFTNILIDNTGITWEDLNFGFSSMINHSYLGGNYPEFIQSTIAKKDVFPDETIIESLITN